MSGIFDFATLLRDSVSKIGVQNTEALSAVSRRILSQEPTLDTVEALRLALHEFQRQYHATWLSGQHGYKAPAQVRHEQCCLLAEAA